MTTIAHNPRLERLRPAILTILVLLLLLALSGCDDPAKDCRASGGQWKVTGQSSSVTLVSGGNGTLIPVTSYSTIHGCVGPR